jgi:DNA-directed RNA polymerase subunit RPC12/RpoP
MKGIPMSKFPIVEDLDDSCKFPPLILDLDIEQELDDLRQAKTEMGRWLKDLHRSKVAQIHQRILEIGRLERFSQEQIALLKKQLCRLITLAEWQYLSETTKVYHCPHCGKTILLKKQSANKVVKCPYKECRKRIKVSV